MHEGDAPTRVAEKLVDGPCEFLLAMPELALGDEDVLALPRNEDVGAKIANLARLLRCAQRGTSSTCAGPPPEQHTRRSLAAEGREDDLVALLLARAKRKRLTSSRHAAGQRVLDKTGNLKAVQKLLGHGSIQTTADIYTDWDIEQLADTMREVLAQDES
jgi:hypothetical protein